MLTNKQKRFLRAEAHQVDPIFQVGKGGVNEAMIAQLNDVLEARELIKVKVLDNCFDSKEDVATQIVEGTQAQLVQLIGSTIILYKESKKNKKIVLPIEGKK